MISSFVIAAEFMRWNNMMNFNIFGFPVFISALLAGVIIPLDSLVALAYPVFAVCNSSALPMNIGRVSNAHHGLSATHPRATHFSCFSGCDFRWSHLKPFLANRTNEINSFLARRMKAFTTAKMVIAMRLCFERLMAMFTRLSNSNLPTFFVKFTVASSAAKIVLTASKHIGFYYNLFSAIRAFCIYHVAPKRKSPFVSLARATQRGKFDCISDLLACPSKSINRDYTMKLEQMCI
jgi:hypothetical protein